VFNKQKEKEWEREFAEFNNKVADIEDETTDLITSAFSDLRSAIGAFLLI